MHACCDCWTLLSQEVTTQIIFCVSHTKISSLNYFCRKPGLKQRELAASLFTRKQLLWTLGYHIPLHCCLITTDNLTGFPHLIASPFYCYDGISVRHNKPFVLRKDISGCKCNNCSTGSILLIIVHLDLSCFWFHTSIAKGWFSFNHNSMNRTVKINVFDIY